MNTVRLAPKKESRESRTLWRGLIGGEGEFGANASHRKAHTTWALGGKQLLKFIQANRPNQITEHQLNKGQYHLDLVVRDVGVARLENATPMKAQPVRSLVRVEDWGLIHVGNCIWQERHLPCSPKPLLN